MYINKDLLFDSGLPMEQIRQFHEVFPEGCKVNEENILKLVKAGIRLDLLFGRFLGTEDRKTLAIRQGAIEDFEHVIAQRTKNGLTKQIYMFEDTIVVIKQEIVEIVMRIASI